jgi:hypothetical protein
VHHEGTPPNSRLTKARPCRSRGGQGELTTRWGRIGADRNPTPEPNFWSSIRALRLIVRNFKYWRGFSRGTASMLIHKLAVILHRIWADGTDGRGDRAERPEPEGANASKAAGTD